MLQGLDWETVRARLSDAPEAVRARVLDLLEGIEGGAVSAHARAAREGRDHG
jgi:hypothetical protein